MASSLNTGLTILLICLSCIACIKSRDIKFNYCRKYTNSHVDGTTSVQCTFSMQRQMFVSGLGRNDSSIERMVDVGYDPWYDIL